MSFNLDYTYSKDFRYTHVNPYHNKLDAYSKFVFRDDEAEQFKSKWRESVFSKNAPLIVEVGSGHGEFMLDYCKAHKDINYVGLDFRFKRTFSLAKQLNKIEEKNFRFLRAKGERLKFIFGENEIDTLFYFFPDPWPKKRHQKKRLFQRPFLESLSSILKKNAQVYIKTDNLDYALWMQDLIEKDLFFEIEFKTQDLYLDGHPFLCSFQTKFEKIFLAQKNKICAFILKNKKNLHALK